MNETAFNTSRFNQSALNASMLSGAGARRQAGFFPPGTPKAIREALVCWYDPARQGATNEKMAENPVLKDLSGNGHDAACRNFAWAGMSGIGGYGFDIKGTFPRNYTGDPLYVCNDHLINVRSLGVGAGLLQVKNIKTVEDYVEVPPFRIRVSGVADAEKRYPGLHWNNIYYYVDETTKLGKVINVSADGEYDLPRSVVPDTMQSFLGFVESHNKETVEAAGGRISVDIRIEIPPSYLGALVGDGVDDYGVAEGLPILTDYTVIAKRAVLTENPSSLQAIARMKNVFIFNIGNGGMASSFGVSTYNLPELPPEAHVVWQTKDSRNGKAIQFGEPPGEAAPLSMFCLDNLYPSGFLSCALWSFLLFSRTLSAEEIEWVKANMVNGYPSPVAYYDCSKYSNVDMGDNPVLEDLSGNGNDLELHNFAFTAESGFDGNGGLVFDGVDDYGANGNFPSFNCKTLMMLFKHGNANAHKIYFDCRLDASTEYAVLFDTENIAFQARNKNGKTYINNKLNDSLRPKDLVDKKYLVAITNGSAEKGTMIKFGGNNTDASGYYANMVLYKALLFGKVLTQEQMEKVIQDYRLMEGVDDVWNEQQ